MDGRRFALTILRLASTLLRAPRPLVAEYHTTDSRDYRSSCYWLALGASPRWSCSREVAISWRFPDAAGVNSHPLAALVEASGARRRRGERVAQAGGARSRSSCGSRPIGLALSAPTRDFRRRPSSAECERDHEPRGRDGEAPRASISRHSGMLRATRPAPLARRTGLPLCVTGVVDTRPASRTRWLCGRRVTVLWGLRCRPLSAAH